MPASEVHQVSWYLEKWLFNLQFSSMLWNPFSVPASSMITGSRENYSFIPTLHLLQINSNAVRNSCFESARPLLYATHFSQYSTFPAGCTISLSSKYSWGQGPFLCYYILVQNSEYSL